MTALPNDDLPAEIDEQQQVTDLPPRTALSIVDPGIFGAGLPPTFGRLTDPLSTTNESAPPNQPSV